MGGKKKKQMFTVFICPWHSNFQTLFRLIFTIFLWSSYYPLLPRNYHLYKLGNWSSWSQISWPRSQNWWVTKAGFRTRGLLIPIHYFTVADGLQYKLLTLCFNLCIYKVLVRLKVLQEGELHERLIIVILKIYIFKNFTMI